ncbi:fluoride efflux transporter CrcB [Litchfieldia alkalitelluris]|uniref:fluoride efflux transporter CrcB n=1 Tax=Litchfieldia alkalitelluris TaxID=304268 RepID=UPI0009984B90|nr:fluoride efflux transporter CrcB [Litchfieldia alkalitelluris]
MIYVGLGGALGAIFRYYLGILLMKRISNPPFPLAMLIVNIIGSFGLGITLSLITPTISPSIQQFVSIGFFGAFTTFSTFSMEAIDLLLKKHYRSLAIYVSLSFIGSTILFILGFYLLK